MPLREGHEFSARSSGTPERENVSQPRHQGGFSFGAACRVMTPTPRRPGSPARVLPVIPGAKRFPVGRDRLGDLRETAVRIYVSRSRRAPPGATPGFNATRLLSDGSLRYSSAYTSAHCRQLMEQPALVLTRLDGVLLTAPPPCLRYRRCSPIALC